MIKTWIGILGMLSLPALSLAQANDIQFRQLALLVLEQRLEQREGAMLNGVLNQISQETHLPDTETRKRLVSLLDSLETQRREKSAGWKALINLGKKQAPSKGVEKFLRQLADDARKALLSPPNRKGGDCDLKTLVADAEQNAQLLPGQGKELALQLLSLGSASTVPRLAGVPQQVRLLVEVLNAPVEVVSATADSPIIGSGAQTKLPDIPQLLLPSLVQDLATSPRIKSAVEQPSAQLPDYRLVVTLADLQDSYNGGPQQQITLTAQLALISLKNEEQVYQRPLIVKRYTSTGKVLDPASAEFCKEVATEIRHALDAYLSAR
ncbi:MAG: hypothetical protein HYW07_05905 [Candidatus Latescibacteria bacterium]|nr:hypothetical protein [Candidatus Latescibacterota bacterium]